MSKIIHKDLICVIKGACFDNGLGPMLPERFYQDALAPALEGRGARCETEKGFEVFYRDVRVGATMWICGRSWVKDCITVARRGRVLTISMTLELNQCAA